MPVYAHACAGLCRGTQGTPTETQAATPEADHLAMSVRQIAGAAKFRTARAENADKIRRLVEVLQSGLQVREYPTQYSIRPVSTPRVPVCSSRRSSRTARSSACSATSMRWTGARPCERYHASNPIPSPPPALSRFPSPCLTPPFGGTSGTQRVSRGLGWVGACVHGVGPLRLCAHQAGSAHSTSLQRQDQSCRGQGREDGAPNRHGDVSGVPHAFRARGGAAV